MIVKDSETVLPDGGSAPITWHNKILLTKDKVRIENDQDKDRIILIHMDEGKIYHLDIKAKTYKKVGLPEGIKDIKGEKQIESQRLDQRKKCGEWDCYGVKVNTKAQDITMEAEYWLAEAIDIPYDLRNRVAEYFGPDQKGLSEELAKYKGYPVHAAMIMKIKDKEIKMTTRVEEIKRLEIEPATFEIPADFRAVDVDAKPGDEKARDPNTEQEDANKPVVVTPKG